MPQPTNSIITIAGNLNGADSAPNKIEPVAPLTTEGFAKGSASYQSINYVLHNFGEWLTWHSEEDTNVRTEFATADTNIRTDFATADTNIRADFATADTNIRTDFATADTNIRTDFATADTNIRADFATADTTLQGNIDTLSQTVTDLTTTVSNLTAQVIKERVSVGEIIEITGDSTNPATLKGYGTWSSFGAGQVLVGVGSHTDSRSEAKTWADGDSEGAYKHMQTTNEVGSHGHTAQAVTDHSHPVSHTSTGVAGQATAGNGRLMTNNVDVGTAYTTSTYISTTGAGGHTPVIDDSVAPTVAMNNTQPTLAVYRWRRTS